MRDKSLFEILIVNCQENLRVALYCSHAIPTKIVNSTIIQNKSKLSPTRNNKGAEQKRQLETTTKIFSLLKYQVSYRTRSHKTSLTKCHYNEEQQYADRL
jgi:hypothetical protein